MVFSSIIFLFGFLPALLICYYNPFFKGRKFRNILLLLASLAFYAWGESLFVFIMIASIAINFFIVILMERFTAQRKLFLGISVFWNISLLFVFKYLSFALKNFSAFFPSLGIPQIEIALPIGISFFTFQIMSYCFDVYYGKAKVQRNILDLALYISLFPQLIAGPIVRYSSVENQIQNRVESMDIFLSGLKRFIIGLSKKCLLANFIALVANYVFKMQVAEISGSVAWIGAVCYSLQIYFDFSGYSDMAIGLGRMFGFQFEENFNYPYMASSVTDFWRRWHISLSSWFRDYVYIPLGGNRCSAARQLLNMFVVWAFTGIWHGANWTFWFWGVYYFALLAIEKSSPVKKILEHKTARILWRIFTLIFIILGWVIFRSPSLSFAFKFIAKMFSFKDFWIGASFAKNCMLFILLCIAASLPILQFAKIKFRENNNFHLLGNIAFLILFALCVVTCLGGAYSPFIYFNF